MMAPWLTLAALSMGATPRGYAVVIGNNAAPEGRGDLQTLRYADDDALRFADLFARAGMKTFLLTVADARTQRKTAFQGAKAEPPTRAQLDATVEQIRAQLDAASPTVIYIYFSGHGGSTSEGEPYLTLLDERLTRRALFEEIVDRLPAERVHLLVDACNAGAVVGVRGPFDDATETEKVAIDPEAWAGLSDAKYLDRRPHVGALVAAAAGRAAHEWSRIEAGVFSHQVYSALVGGADVNDDRRVEYSEVEAFVSAAGARVEDQRARLGLRSRPPALDQRSPLFRLDWLSGGPFLVGRTRAPLRMYLEHRDGSRLWDVHLDADAPFRLALPLQPGAFVRTPTAEAALPDPASSRVELGRLRFEPRQLETRGALEDALRRGLFAEPFGAAYYLGYARSRDLVAVDTTNTPAIEAPLPNEVESRSWYVPAAWVGAATAAGLSIAAGAFALERESAFDGAASQTEAVDIVEARDLGRDLAFGALAAAGALSVTAALLELLGEDDGPSFSVNPSPETWRAHVGWRGRF